MTTLKAPFPAFGGKSRIAPEVWSRLGDPRNYVEPFAFSAAMLLKRPNVGAVETIGDRNVFVSNFWRAVQRDPEAVAAHADWPVHECCLHARHRWLVGSSEATAILQRVRDDPEYYDAKIAGWWCWGACCWIGSGWCDEDGGRNSAEWQQRPGVAGSITGIATNPGPHDNRPVLDTTGRGITTDTPHRPQLADAFSRGRGVNGNDGLSACDARRKWINDWMLALADRLRPVRVCCGHWSRICDSPSTMTRLGLTGAFLDPPYRTHLSDGTANRTKHIYANDRNQDINALCDEVQAWCLKWGSDPLVRIALCGLEGEYPEIDAAGWTKWAWKSNGGYGNRKAGNAGNENAHRERVWFSPHCLDPHHKGLFQ